MTGSPIVSIRVLHLNRRIEFDWEFPDLCAPYWRFYWNLSGASFVTIGRTTRELRPCTAYLIPPDTRFSGRGTGLDHFYIHFVLPGDAVCTRTGIYEVSGSDRLRPTVEALAEDVVRDFHRCASTRQNADSVMKRAPCTIGAAGLVLTALARLPEDVSVANVTDPLVRDAIRFMSGRLDARLTSDEIAAACRCDERTLRRRFRSELGTTPVQYAARRRIEHGCMLLHFTAMSIEEIARQTGFCDRHHFTRAFQRARGTTPAAFRRISDQLTGML
jgi:AraC-like DNA-binding protein